MDFKNLLIFICDNSIDQDLKVRLIEQFFKEYYVNITYNKIAGNFNDPIPIDIQTKEKSGIINK